MEKIVVVQEIKSTWESDECEQTYCFMYSSPEAWLVDFDTELKKACERKKNDWDNNSSEFEFCGKIFVCHDFCNMYAKSTKYHLPKVYSLNEWFEVTCGKVAEVKK